MDTVTRQAYTLLADLVSERVGIYHAQSDLDLFASKVQERMTARGFQTPLDYYYCIRYDENDASEFDALIDALVVNETYFFRELAALTVLVEERIVPAVARGERPRIWSAACATGEEPITLAMLLADRGILDRVEIVASDISRRALERAKAGVYGGRALRAVAPGVANRWLERQDERMVVRPELREAIRWQRLNLLDRAAIARLGSFDSILCRNVLIYFADDISRRVTESLRNALVPGGWLLVGVSESLLRLGTALVCEEHRGVFCYRRES